MIFTRFLALVLVVITVTFVACVESSLNQNTHVVYTRYVRRKPYRHDKTKFIEEILEVYNTKRRPPPYGILNDKERNIFIRCDFDPSLPECYLDGQLSTTRRTQVRPIITTTPKTLLSTTVSVPKLTPKPQPPPPTTTSTTTTTTTTTTTPRAVPSTPNINQLPPTTPSPQTSTTEDLPLLPDIDEDDEDREPNSYDENEYEEETENYVDQNKNYDDTDDDDTKKDIKLGALTQETTTTLKPKSFFGFF